VDANLDRRLTLARRLRALRQEHWPGISLTQGQLAQALGGDYRLSVPLISSWESVTNPKVPPLRHLNAYATFFATPRSIEGRPRLLTLSELTDDELRAKEELLQELTQLRTNVTRDTEFHYFSNVSTDSQITRPEGHLGHVFISYIREDAVQVDRLHRMFEGARIPVWRDTVDLLPGEEWGQKIRAAITDNALVFIACFSRRSVGRDKSYQNEELTLAIEQLRQRNPAEPWLIPVRFDECIIPDRSIGAGRTLASIQRADLFGDRIDEDAKRLLAVVRRILG
jgi:hypothetical protein